MVHRKLRARFPLSEPNEPQPTRPRPFLSLSLRELLLLVVIVALALVYFLPRDVTSDSHSNAPFRLMAPIEYRYWHQRGNTEAGTGRIGSGDEWLPAKGIEVYENFVILHLDDGVDRMVEREGLRWFDWRRAKASK